MGSETLTYGELELRATQLAHRLHALGAGPGTVVGLGLERSLHFVTAALAIMKCGAAYLPMDLAHPVERLRFIAEDAALALLVTRQPLAGRFADFGVSIVAVDDVAAGEPRPPVDFHVTADSLAYVIYTSGSTGRPKGVEVTHGNLANLVSWHIGAFGVDASARATFQAGVGFDAGVWEVWPYLAAGAAVSLPDEFTRFSAADLRDWLVAQRITISFVPTAVAEQLISLPWPPETALRVLLTGADTLHRYPPPGLPFALVNNYGPTEGTVVATSGTIAPNGNPDGLPSIGLPIANVRIYILDGQLREVPRGVTGELCIGGAGVARGYRNRPDLTAERFVADPFSPRSGRMYRTGDLARFLPNGEIAFLGRMDDQIKIRGYRIELNEINAVLNEHPSVQASVVMVREDVPGARELAAYIVPMAGVSPDEKGLREFVRLRLPHYMEPAAFVWMEALPLTPNGKVDRAALPRPEAEQGGGDEASVSPGAAPSEVEASGFAAPKNDLERQVAEIWMQVLKLDRVGVHDDFFEIGGHSLAAIQVLARLRRSLHAELNLRQIFEHPTIAGFAATIHPEGAQPADGAEAREEGVL